MPTPITELDQRIRARTPIILITSHEEGAVIKEIVAMAKSRKREVWSWSLSDGISPVLTNATRAKTGWQIMAQVMKDNKAVTTNGAIISVEGLNEPSAGLSTFRNWHTATSGDPSTINIAPHIFVIKGLWNSLIDSHGQVANNYVARILRDIAQEFPGGSNTLVLIDPYHPIPRELEKDVVVVDWGLPTPADLDGIIDRVTSSNRAEVNLNGSREAIVRALSGLTSVEAENAISLAIIKNKKFDASALPVISSEKAQIVRKSGVAEIITSDDTLDQVGGLDRAKAFFALQRAAFSAKAKEYGLDNPMGCLLVGEPGTGKTLLAKVFGGREFTIINLSVAALKASGGGFVGRAESALLQVIKTSVACAPSVLLIDEIEKFFGGSYNDSGTTSGMLAIILTFMQENRHPVYPIATANDPSNLPPELVSRFDKAIFVDRPNVAACREIYTIHLGKRHRDPSKFDLAEIAAQSHAKGFVGRELERAVKLGMAQAFSQGREVETADLLAAAKGIRPMSAVMPEKIERLREWGALYADPASSDDPLAVTLQQVQPGRVLEI